MRRLPLLLLTTCFVALAAGSTAAAGDDDGPSRCTTPDEPGWRSCLRTVHRAQDDEQIVLRTATARLVMRVDDCPRRRPGRRRMTVRDADGKRLGARTVRGRCRNEVIRWTARVRPDATLAEGAVVHSVWSRLADGRSAPEVKLR